MKEQIAGCATLGVEMSYYSMRIGNILNELNMPLVDVAENNGKSP